jgi:hypothetical protein
LASTKDPPHLMRGIGQGIRKAAALGTESKKVETLT